MKKYIKFSLALFFLIFIPYKNYSMKNMHSIDDTKKLKSSFKELLVNENLSMDIGINNKYENINNRYSNNYFGVSIDFPNYWEADRGPAESSLYRVFSNDSAISMGVNAIPFLIEQSSEYIYNIQSLNSKFNGDFKSYLMNSIIKQFPNKINNFQLIDYKEGNNNYINYSWGYTASYNGIEVPMISEIYQTMFFGTQFSIYYYTPKVFYDKNRFEKVIENTFFFNPNTYK